MDTVDAAVLNSSLTKNVVFPINVSTFGVVEVMEISAGVVSIGMEVACTNSQRLT